MSIINLEEIESKGNAPVQNEIQVGDTPAQNGQVIDLEKLEQKKAEPETQAPGFWKKLDMITTGVHRGVSHFTLKLLSAIPSDTLRDRIKVVDSDIQKKFDDDIKKHGAGYSKGGEIAGEILATLPMGGVYGKALQGASAVGKALPIGLKTLGKYGTAGLLGAGTLAATESQRYNPDDPSQLFNTEAATNTLKSPGAYIAPMVGAKMGTWMDKSRQLQQAREHVKEILPRDIGPPGASRKLSQTVFDALPAITGLGKRTKQIESVGDDVQRLITKIAGGNEALTSKDLTKFAGQQLQKSLAVMQKGKNELWNKGFKVAPIKNPSAVKAVLQEGIDALQESGLPLTTSTVKLLTKGLKSKSFTVEQVKNYQSLLGKAAASIQSGQYGGLGQVAGQQLRAIREKLYTPIERSLSKGALADFGAARAYSRKLFELEQTVPGLKKALVDEVAARKLIKSLISPVESFKKSTLMGVMTPQGLQAAKAARIAKAMESSNVGGNFSIGSFLKKTAEHTDVPELLGDSYDALKGLNKYLSVIDQANKSKTLTRSLVAAGAAAGAGGYMIGSEDPSTAAMTALVSYPAALFAANHPWAKRAFGAMSKNMSDSAFKYMSNKVSENLSRAGFYIFKDDQGQSVLKQQEQPDG